MAAANPQPCINLNPIGGNVYEHPPYFESFLRSLIKVGNVPKVNQTQFLQLNLHHRSLQFFSTLPQATRDDFDTAIAALRNIFS